MNQTSDIWFAFARTFSMLFLVLALLILAFYLIKRFSENRAGKGNKDYIKILSVHHLSPKEKLILVNVLGETLLIGVTPSQISKISKVDQPVHLPEESSSQPFEFSDFLSRKLGKTFGQNSPLSSNKEQTQ